MQPVHTLTEQISFSQPLLQQMDLDGSFRTTCQQTFAGIVLMTGEYTIYCIKCKIGQVVQ